MFSTVLIANRGAIATRILRSLEALGINGIAVYHEADLASLHVARAQQAVSLGAGTAADTYLDADRLLAVAHQTGAQAIHPGYGFLSENADFAEACEAAGIVFLGPTPQQMRQFGLKHTARALAEAAGLPLLPGTGLLDTIAQAQAAAATIGYPVMLKSTAGGGGIGMRVCVDAEDLARQFDAVRQLGQKQFRDDGVFLEKYIARARHLEVQIFGDGGGGVIALGERDCSVQRRNQKVIEEAPAPNLDPTTRTALHTAAVRLAQSVNYRSAGTVEFVYDSDAGQFYFLEVNTRLQVEHGVTEQVYGVDLVRWMIELGAGSLPPLDQLAAGLQPQGHAIQARLYAEDPGKDFQPSPGLLTEVVLPPSDGRALRVDTWVQAGVEVPPLFDPMIAKLIAWAPDRARARARLDAALAQTRLYGVETNRLYLQQILGYAAFAEGRAWTRCLQDLPYRAPTVDVVRAGTQTTVQDLPGRLGYWAVGIPPSGPMDSRSLRDGNRLLGNPETAPALEITLAGPALRFNAATTVVVTGATLPLLRDGEPVPMYTPVTIAAGATLDIGAVAGAGARAYLCVQGGFAVPHYLGSASTFTLGQFGGHAGRALRVGDVLHLADARAPTAPASTGSPVAALELPPVRQLRVMIGPHAAPDFLTPAGLDTFLASEWTVHFNSSRTGIRLIGPKPDWARAHGGEAGLHPSNIHDNAYAIGAVDFTGDMPVILGPDGPSLGGFVCPVTVIEADLWQLGQLKAGDRLRFLPVAMAEARAIVTGTRTDAPTPVGADAAVVLDVGTGATRLVARLAGDTHLLLEFGPPEIDLATRFRGDALMTALEAAALPGIIDLTPGIRSLQLHRRPDAMPLAALLDTVKAEWLRVCAADTLRLPSRIVHLPLSWDDPSTRLAIEKYQTTVRPGAPWCPSNLEFIRRINGLDSIEAVKRIVFDAHYLVMGLGDVYLGAPVATPLDPRHRLVTTKYNPARTWTPENAVGIGGAYLCVYGMEGPGGYQFVGRTLQMWNRHQAIPAFHGQPYLLRFFDQIRFFEVSADELTQIRRAFPLGRYPLRIEETTLDLADYQQFLTTEAASIAAFRQCQQTAFEAERADWAANGQDRFELPAETPAPADSDEVVAVGDTGVYSPVAGNLWQMRVAPGETVAAGQVLAVIEAMKMEIQVTAAAAGTVSRTWTQPGRAVRTGQLLVSLSAG